MKTLKIFKEVYAPKSPDENNFVRKHVIQKTPDKNGNKDEVFNGDNVKAVDRKATHHGYNPSDDEKVYEAKEEKCPECGKVHKGTCTNESVSFRQVKKLSERHMSPGEIKKKEKIAKAIEREHPEMPVAKKIAIATARAMGEEAENLDENAQDQYDLYHKHARELLGHLSKALDDHKKAAKDYNPTLAVGASRGAHWGHVGDIKRIKRDLEDLHDSITQSGEYAKGGM